MVHDVIATIYGSVEPDHYVVMGNHRDAWVFGAVDPNSGTAALLEIARGLNVLRENSECLSVCMPVCLSVGLY